LIYRNGIWEFDVYFNELPTKIQSFLSGYEWGEDLKISSTIPITAVISEFTKEFGRKIEFSPNEDAKQYLN